MHKMSGQATAAVDHIEQESEATVLQTYGWRLEKYHFEMLSDSQLFHLCIIKFLNDLPKSILFMYSC